MKKYFYNSEFCYDLDHIKDAIHLDGLTEAKVFEAYRITGEGLAWCNELSEVLEKSEGGCGKMCNFYKPRNGKSGICSHQGYCYTQGKEVLIKI